MSAIPRLTATRRLQWCSGHVVAGHENKCAHPHGHNYVGFFSAEARVIAHPLDDLGRVVDFSVLKARIGAWVERNWDHGFVLAANGTGAGDYAGLYEALKAGGWKVHLMPTNPTAENMAEFLLRVVCPLVLDDTDVLVTKVQLWETENCYVEAEL